MVTLLHYIVLAFKAAPCDRLRCCRFEHGLQISIKISSDFVDVGVPKLAEGGDRPIILECDTVAVLAKEHSDRCIEAGRDAVAGHFCRGKRIANVVLYR